MSPLYTIKHIGLFISGSQRATESVDGLQNFRKLCEYKTSDGLKFILPRNEGDSRYGDINPYWENYRKQRQYWSFYIVIPQMALLKMRSLPYQTNFGKGRSDSTFYSAKNLHVYLTILLLIFLFFFFFSLLKVLNILFWLERCLPTTFIQITEKKYLWSQMG